jgi:hypothetical protein
MKDCSPDYFYSTQRFTPLSKELYQGTKPKNYKYLDNAKYKKFDYVVMLKEKLQVLSMVAAL